MPDPITRGISEEMNLRDEKEYTGAPLESGRKLSKEETQEYRRGKKSAVMSRLYALSVMTAAVSAGDFDVSALYGLLEKCRLAEQKYPDAPMERAFAPLLSYFDKRFLSKKYPSKETMQASINELHAEGILDIKIT